jgi:Fur family peroxide stress response transcriptional regulator
MNAGTYRYSRQREAILGLLQSDRLHLTADEIHDRVRGTFPNLSLGTVYRNLRILQEIGHVRELAYDGGPNHYEAVREPHYHLVCRRCRRIEDVPIPDGPTPAATLTFPSGWHVESHRMEFHGLCRDCRRAS